jgi:hypothetical protein
MLNRVASDVLKEERKEECLYQFHPSALLAISMQIMVFITDDSDILLKNHLTSLLQTLNVEEDPLETNQQSEEDI